MPFKKRNLEREERQDEVEISCHDPRAILARRPNLRRHIVRGWDRRIFTLHAARDAMGEIGAIDANENIRPRRKRVVRSDANPTKYLRDTWHDFAQAHYRCCIQREEALQALRRHRSAANANYTDRITADRANTLHQFRPQRIPG